MVSATLGAVMSFTVPCRSGLASGIGISNGSQGFLGRVSSSSMLMLIRSEVADWEILGMEVGIGDIVGLGRDGGAAEDAS